MKNENNLIPSLPKGFKDRWGKELALKKKIINIIEVNFKKYGFLPLETSPMEISENIGSFLADDDANPMSDVFSFKDDKESLTLRYDMSAPLARFVAQNFRELTFPYKRYTYGDVFRREKPDSARYRSFMQFDADIIGNVNEAQADAEICNIIADTFLNCGLKLNQFSVNVSNRKVIQGLISELNITNNQELKVIRAIDKLERVGLDGVKDLLQKERKDESGAVTKGANLTNDQASQIIEFLKIKDIKSLKSNIKNNISQEGINEIEELFNILNKGKFSNLVKTNFNIVRGLDYYSGFCVETNLNFKGKNARGKEIDIGSCASGGRYNSLIKRFKGVDFKGTGMSIGLDRLVFALNQLDQFQEEDINNILVCVLDQNYLDQYYKIVNELRENNINSEIYLDSTKNLKKQLTYADKKGCSLAIICGQEEIEQNKITIKKLKSKKENDQISISSKNLINEIKKLI
tara:strand:+ start:43 stop:1431 length:1389 start_codon:yes stop_codon:yes gene_type:complete